MAARDLLSRRAEPAADASWCWRRLKPLLEDPAVLKIGHNLKYDWVMFAKAGIDVAPYDDTMVMSFDLDAGRSRPRHGRAGQDCISTMSASPSRACAGPAASRSPSTRCRCAQATEYAAEDADITLAAVAAAEAAAGARRASTRVYERVDRPLVAAIGRMERRGVKVDRDYLAKLSGEFATEIAALEEQVYEAAVRAVHDRLAAAAWARCCTSGLGLKGGRKGKSGTYSTDVTELERLAAEGVECARLVLEWRQLTKLKIDLHRRAAGADQPGDRAGPHQLQPVGRADRAAVARPTPICRTSRSAPRSAARSATPSSPSRAMC